MVVAVVTTLVLSAGVVHRAEQLVPDGGLLPSPQTAERGPRQRLLFDEGWRFAFGHTFELEKDFGYGRGQPFAKAGRAPGALSAGFDDSQWRRLDLPHDWAVELPFQNGEDKSLRDHGYKPVGRAFPATTIGWYRKSFDIPVGDELHGAMSNERGRP